MNYYEFIEKPFGRLLHRSPLKWQYIVCNLLGTIGFVLNVRGVRRDLMRWIGTVFAGKKDQNQVKQIARQATISNLRYFADLGFLMYHPARKVRDVIDGKIYVRGYKYLQEALSHQKGIFLVSAHFACFYYTLFAPLPEVQRVTLIRRFDSPGRELLLRRMEKLTGKQIDAITIAPRSAMEILNRLRNKQIVACMFDYVYEDTSLVIADFLGRPAITPATVSALAARAGAVLLPCIGIRERDYIVVYFDSPIYPLQTDDLYVDIFHYASAINRVISKYICAYPEQWDFWRSLDLRWNYRLDEVVD